MFLSTPIFRPFYGTLTLLVLASVLGGVTIQPNSPQGKPDSVREGTGGSLFRLGRRILADLFQYLASINGTGHGADRRLEIYLRRAECLEHHPPGHVGIAHAVVAGVGSDWRGLREAASVTIIIVILMTLGLALVARVLGLRVGIQDK